MKKKRTLYIRIKYAFCVPDEYFALCAEEKNVSTFVERVKFFRKIFNFWSHTRTIFHVSSIIVYAQLKNVSCMYHIRYHVKRRAKFLYRISLQCKKRQRIRLQMTMDKKRAIFLESLSDRTARFLVCASKIKKKRKKKKGTRTNVGSFDRATISLEVRSIRSVYRVNNFCDKNWLLIIAERETPWD